jgi:dihydroorotate dehydrogenase (fumarate)
VQVVSTLYNNGAGQIRKILDGLERWMGEKSFDTLDDFRGRLSYKEVDDPAVFERIQFMKYYAGLS